MKRVVQHLTRSSARFHPRGIFVALLAFAGASTNVGASTLDIYLNSDWTYNHDNAFHDDCDDNVWLNIHDYTVTVGTETRKYYGGHFTAVSLWDATGSTLMTNFACNCVFYIKNSHAYSMNVNSNGSTDGLTGGAVNPTCNTVTTEATAFFTLSNGDLIITGNFGAAGGNDHAYNFTCYEWSYGWLHAQGINVNCPLAAGDVIWNNYRLDIFVSSLNTLNGPTSSGGTKVSTSVSMTHQAFWNGYNNSFVNGYWQTQ